MPEETASSQHLRIRLERLAVLEDRAARSASDAGDLAEALKLAREAHADARAARQRAAEVSGWRTLAETNVQLLEQAGPHLQELANQRKISTAFFRVLGSPKVLLGLGIPVILIIGALVGALTIEPVSLPLPGQQLPAPEAREN